MIWIRIGAVSALIAVIAGAFGAHGLGGNFERLYKDVPNKVVAGQEVSAIEKYFNDYKTAAEYQMTHSLGLIAIGLLSLISNQKNRALTIAGICMFLGIVLFSGSLYLLTLFYIPKLGMITPIGGLLMLAGWVSLAFSGLRTVP